MAVREPACLRGNFVKAMNGVSRDRSNRRRFLATACASGEGSLLGLPLTPAVQQPALPFGF